MFKRLLRFLVKLVCWFLALSFFAVLLLKWVPVYFTPLMLIRSYEQWQDKKPMGWEHQWVPLETMSAQLPLAVICSEDQKFMKHQGFDFKAIEKVLKNYQQQQRLRGASTISQQTAKNVFLWPGRSWIRKGLEAYFTFLIELLWPKHRIMEVYLNSIEMGPGIYGAEAASSYWFGQSASNLSANQAAAIAAILPSPLVMKATPPTTYIEKRIQWIRMQMRLYGSLKWTLQSEGRDF